MSSVCTSFNGKLISIGFAKSFVEEDIVNSKSINASFCSKHGFTRSKLLSYNWCLLSAPAYFVLL